MFASSKSGSVSAPTDSKFNYVTMLLHGNGTNGAQNNTFVDSSTNNFTITRNGNTTQGTFTPYGSNWSNYFNGSTDYLSTNTSAYAFGTANFTLEAWVYFNSFTGTPRLFYGFGGSVDELQIYITTGGVLGLETNNANGATGGTIALNTWTHIATVRNGSTITGYLNGTSVCTYTDAGDVTPTTALIGSYRGSSGYLSGYVSNARVVKSAVYTGNFTPSTTPLTAISGTSLLTCQSNRFIDNSTNAFAITVNGSPSVQRFSPFSPTTAYSTSVIGGSGYFDGSGDRLSSPASTSIDLSTADFTIDCWVYPTSFSATKAIIVYQNSDASNTNYGYWLTIKTSGVVRFENFSGSSQVGFDSSIAINLNTWNHIAVTRTGTSATTYINGVGTTGTVSATFNAPVAAILNIGDNYGAVFGSSNPYLGYMTDLRIVKGTRVYTANFTPPTAPLTAITNTSLLLSYTNAGIFDNAMMNDLETVGNAQISTSVKKYGTGSMYFDGTGDYLTRPASDLFAFGTGDFTIEFWAYKTANTSGSYDVAFGTGDVGTGNNGYFIELSSTRGFVFASGNAVVLSYAMNPNTSSWKFYTITRSGTTLRLFVDGTVVASTTYSTSLTSTVSVRVGGTAGDFFGYIDDLRITKGYARYTSNFTAPTAAFADKG